MKIDKLKNVKNKTFNFIKFVFKPEWKRIILFIMLFLILPQRVSGEFTLFGGVYLIKYLVETYHPNLDITTTVLILLISYIAVSLIVWLYDKNINKFFANESEADEGTVEDPQEEETA